MVKKKEPVYLEAQSPQELDRVLEYIAERNELQQRFASLDIYGHGIFVQQFEMPNMKEHELKNALRLEAVELLSLSPEDVDIDYQILHAGETIKGVFAAISSNILGQHISFLNKAKLIPLKVSALILHEVNMFYKDNFQKIKDKNCCLISNPKDRVINLAIFNKANLELLRDIYFVSPEEMEHETVETIKYYLGKNTGKRLDEIYMITGTVDADKLSKALEAECDAKIFMEQRSGRDVSHLNFSGQDLFNINLIKKSSVSISARKAMLYCLNIAIIVLICIAGMQLYRLKITHAKMNRVKYSFNPEDYKYARDLAAKKELLKNVK